MTGSPSVTSRPPVDAHTPPVWDLSGLYNGMDAPEIQRDLHQAQASATNFRERYEGKVAQLSGVELAGAIRSYEALEDLLGRLGSYAQLLYAGDASNPKITQFYQNIQEREVAISGEVLFFTLELNALEEAVLKEKLADESVRYYASWLRDVRVYRPHVLSAELEKLLHEKQLSSRAAWIRLFDETEEALRFHVDGKILTMAEVLDLLSSSDAKTREAAAKELGRVLEQHIRTFALITNTLAKDKEIEDNWRKYPRPISSRNLANLVEDEVVDALQNTVRDNYVRLSHRYYTLKAKWFGKRQLPYWDRNAPLPDEDDTRYGWREAQDIVLNAYEAFSPRFAEIGRRFFAGNWIDAEVRPGKSSGAFSHPTTPSAHPFILMNFQGKLDDVMTLAHELGHGVHQVLAGKQGALMAGTPLTLAETASVFGEQLVFQSLLKQQQDAKRRKHLIASKVEDMLNTVVRQVAFCEFERRLHTERREGELTPDRIGEIWMGVQYESLGDAISFSEEYRHYWAYIPHFIHTPFYVYAYAFGDCLVNALYGVYRQGMEGFEEKYIRLLEAGGTLRHKELLAPFGLDAGKPDFWQHGLDIIAGYIDELENISL